MAAQQRPSRGMESLLAASGAGYRSGEQLCLRAGDPEPGPGGGRQSASALLPL